MVEAREESPAAKHNHALLALAALTEAFSEPEARVTRLETGPEHRL